MRIERRHHPFPPPLENTSAPGSSPPLPGEAERDFAAQLRGLDLQLDSTAGTPPPFLFPLPLFSFENISQSLCRKALRAAVEDVPDTKGIADEADT
jgi:hypothetical protein